MYPLGTIPPGYHVHLPLSSLSDLPSSELATAIQGQAAVLVTDNPHLAQTDHLPVLSALRP